MQRSIIFLERTYRQLEMELDSYGRTFCLAKWNIGKEYFEILVRELISVGQVPLTEIVERARQENSIIVQVYRPGSNVGFPGCTRYEVHLCFEGEKADAWIYDGKTTWSDRADEVKVIGFPIRRIKMSNSWMRDMEPNPKIFDRLIRLMGPESLRDFINSRFCIVGAGRAGSEIYRKLVRLGIRQGMLVDFDKIELANLIGLEGSRVEDAGKGIYKVDFLKRRVKKIAPYTKIIAIAKSILDPEALRKAKQTNVLINVSDSALARVATNILAVQYLKPLIDAGVTAGRQGEELLGHVQVVIPGRGCLVCREGLALQEAFQEQLSETEEVLATKRGYGEDGNRGHAALPTFSAWVADYVVIQALNLFSGFLPFRPYTSFNLLAQTNLAVAEEDPPYSGCVLCGRNGLLGRGDTESFPYQKRE